MVLLLLPLSPWATFKIIICQNSPGIWRFANLTLIMSPPFCGFKSFHETVSDVHEEGQMSSLHTHAVDLPAVRMMCPTYKTDWRDAEKNPAVFDVSFFWIQQTELVLALAVKLGSTPWQCEWVYQNSLMEGRHKDLSKGQQQQQSTMAACVRCKSGTTLFK